MSRRETNMFEDDYRGSGEKSAPRYPKEFEELRKKVAIRDALKVVLSLAWYGVAGAYFYFNIYGKYEIKLTDIIAILYLIFLATLPFWLIKVHKVFFDLPWEGVVQSVTSTTVLDVNASKIYKKKKVLLLIIRENSGIIKKVRLPGGQFAKTRYYKPGDTVRHYHGLKYLYKVNNNKVVKTANAPKDEIPCLWCGCMNFSEESRCYECKTKLAK